MIRKLVTGGQSGVDRSVLDFAVENAIPYGGWVPAGGWAEDHPDAPGVLALYKNLVETPSKNVQERTMLNVRDSDGSIVFLPSQNNEISPGTSYQIKVMQRLEKPYIIVSLENPNIKEVTQWIKKHKIQILNIGGPRASEYPEGYKQAKEALLKILL